MLLLDTSAWIEVFWRQKPLDLDRIGGLGEVVTCLPVVQEVLQGFRDESAFRVARKARLLASLNHSNIAHVCCFEGATLADGATAHFLAMELGWREELVRRMSEKK